MTLEEYLSKNYSPTATTGYNNLIKRYLLAVGDKALGATHSDILAYVGLLRTQNLHPKSLRNNLFAIKIYYTYLVHSGQRSDHPCRWLNLKDRIDKQIQLESLYPRQTLDNLYNSWQSHSPKDQNRDKIIISLLIYQALSVLEITQIKTSDIDLEQATIRIRGNTKNKGRTLSLKASQICLFQTLLQQNSCSEYFLLNRYGVPFTAGAINRVINQYKDKKDRLQPLKIRQSVIAHLLKEGNDVRIVQEFAGHRCAGSTESYKQSGLEELKTAIDRLHPLQ